MASNYPTSLDNFTNPTSNDSLNSPSHSLQHANINDAVEAIEVKLGIGASPAGSATSGYVLTAGTGGTTTWSALPASGGLTLITPTSIVKGASGSATVNANGSITFTGTESVAVNGVFSSTYDNYRLIWNITSGSTNVSHRMRMRASGTDLTSLYGSGGFYVNDGGSTGSMFSGNTTFIDLNYTEPNLSTFSGDIHNPYLATYTHVAGFVTCGVSGVSSVRAVFTGARVFNTTQYDGATFYAASGTMTGTLAIYGYRN